MIFDIILEVQGLLESFNKETTNYKATKEKKQIIVEEKKEPTKLDEDISY